MSGRNKGGAAGGGASSSSAAAAAASGAGAPPHQLLILEQPLGTFFKEEGGQANVLRMVVYSPVPLDTAVPLRVTLQLDNGTHVADERSPDNTLEVRGRCELKPGDGERTKAEILFRINKVSQRYDHHKYRLRVDVGDRGSLTVGAQKYVGLLAGVCSSDIEVLSKRKKHAKDAAAAAAAAGLFAPGGGSSSAAAGGRGGAGAVFHRNAPLPPADAGGAAAAIGFTGAAPVSAAAAAAAIAAAAAAGAPGGSVGAPGAGSTAAAALSALQGDAILEQLKTLAGPLINLGQAVAKLTSLARKNERRLVALESNMATIGSHLGLALRPSGVSRLASDDGGVGAGAGGAAIGLSLSRGGTVDSVSLSGALGPHGILASTAAAARGAGAGGGMHALPLPSQGQVQSMLMLHAPRQQPQLHQYHGGGGGGSAVTFAGAGGGAVTFASALPPAPAPVMRMHSLFDSNAMAEAEAAEAAAAAAQHPAKRARHGGGGSDASAAAASGSSSSSSSAAAGSAGSHSTSMPPGLPPVVAELLPIASVSRATSAVEPAGAGGRGVSGYFAAPSLLGGGSDTGAAGTAAFPPLPPALGQRLVSADVLAIGHYESASVVAVGGGSGSAAVGGADGGAGRSISVSSVQSGHGMSLMMAPNGAGGGAAAAPLPLPSLVSSPAGGVGHPPAAPAAAGHGALDSLQRAANALGGAGGRRS